MLDPAELAELVRRKIAAGVLPTTAPTKAWVGHGTNATCDICDRPISPEDIECEVDLADVRMLRLHLRCHTTWNADVSQTGS
jgi:hypothetical protein